MSIDPTAEDYYRNATIDDVSDWEATQQTDKLANLCRFLMRPDTREPAEPVREWRVNSEGHPEVPIIDSAWGLENARYIAISHSRRGYQNVRVQFSDDGGETWQDADTSAAEGTK